MSYLDLSRWSALRGRLEPGISFYYLAHVYTDGFNLFYLSGELSPPRIR